MAIDEKAVATRPIDPTWIWVRRIALGTYVVVFLIATKQVGLPITHDVIFEWAAVGLALACIGRPWRTIPQLLIDWVPFVAVVIAYDYSRGWADSAGFGVHFTPQITADKILFFGHVPSEFLQEHLYHPVVHFNSFLDPEPRISATGSTQWYEMVFDLTYVSHYLASFVLAAVLWTRSRARFQAYARRFCTLSAMGFLTYVLFPAAPPWLAYQDGYLHTPVGRVGGRGFSLLHLDFVRNTIEDGAKLSNLVAAVPSLHAGFATLIAITLWPRTEKWRWARIPLALYPALMGLMLVATGEHYVVDILLGVVYAFIAHWMWNRIERWWTARRSAPAEDVMEPGSVTPASGAPRPV